MDKRFTPSPLSTSSKLIIFTLRIFFYPPSLFLPVSFVSSCFLLFLPSCCFLFLPVASCFFQYHPVSTIFSSFLLVFMGFFQFLPASSCFPRFFQFILHIYLQELGTHSLGLVIILFHPSLTFVSVRLQ